MGLSEGIVEATLRRAGDRRVSAVRVRVGGHPVDPAVIDMGFQLAAHGTVADGARIEVVFDPMRLHCRNCGAESSSSDIYGVAACPACGGVDVEAIGTEQAVLESVTYSPTTESARR
jgi:hydrogenase nickel incorporation protein HypA/HybF